MTGAEWLTDDVIEAVARHMNTDHADDNVVICRGLGGCPDTIAARFVGMTTTGARFAATVPEGQRDVEVTFAEAVTERSQVRTQVAALYHRSVEMLAEADQ